MGAVLVPVLLLAIVIIAGVIAVKRFSADEVRRSDRLQDRARPALRYVVPPGQDPALVLTGLRNAGYDASADSEPGASSPIVIIGSTGGAPDREAVRRTLAHLDGTNIVPGESGSVAHRPVRFADE
jgi:hypothetical protein